MLSPPQEGVPQNVTQPVVEQIREEVITEHAATIEEITTEREIIVDLGQSTKEDKPTTAALPVEEKVVEEITTEILAVTDEVPREESIVVELATSGKEQPKETMVESREEAVVEEDTRDMSPTIEGVIQEFTERAITYARPWKSDQKQSLVLTQAEHLNEEVALEIAAPVEETGREQDIVVDLGSFRKATTSTNEG